MSSAETGMVELPVGGPEVMLAKAKVFKEIGALVNTGFFPKAIDTVQKAMAVCWMADAVGAHPMTALQECYVIHGKVGFEYKFKISLVESKVPGFDYEDITPDGEEQEVCILRGWREGMEPKTIKYTMDQAKRAGRLSNPLYKTNPEDMLFKQAMHRLLDRVAGHALRGLPVPELIPVGEGSPDPDAAPAEPASSAAEVIENAAENAAGDVAEVLNIPKPEGGDYTKALGELLKDILGKRSTKKKRLELCENVMSSIRGEKIVYRNAALLSPSDAQEIYEHLMGEKMAPAEGRAAEPVKAGSSGLGEGTPAPPAEEDDPEDQVPDPEPEAEDNATEDLNARVETLFELAKAAKKSHPRRTFIKEAPAGGGVWWFVDQPILKERGHKASVMLQKNGEQRVDPQECAKLAKMMREAGVGA